MAGLARRRIAVFLLAAFWLEGAATAAAPKRPRITLKRRMDLLLAGEAAKSARWGIRVVSLGTGAVVYEKNAGEHFAPASNAKLFSTALALERLGPDHRFHTTIVAAGSPDARGSIEGDLRLVGGGDPTLSGRAYPYQKDAEPADPAEPIEQLAEQVLRKGVRIIAGDIIGDDRLFLWAPYPEGWTIDDSIWEYGAPVSALVFNDNAFTLSLRPAAEPQEPAIVSLNPPFAPVWIDNRVLTVANSGSQVHLDRAAGTRQIRVYGTIGMKRSAIRQLLAVDDPALYAALALYDALTRRGVQVQGGVTALHRWNAAEEFHSGGVELARRTSPPLLEIARVVNKVSQNLHAEILLREAARVRRGEASREAGLKELSQFLDQIGVPAKAYHFEDASGLSRRTLVSPAAVTALLLYMHGRKDSEAWESLLPVGGEDGTLAARFDKSPGATGIHAKTGTLATANALSGYLTTGGGVRLAFSILANNHTVPSPEIRKVIDRIGLALLDWEGK